MNDAPKQLSAVQRHARDHPIRGALLAFCGTALGSAMPLRTAPLYVPFVSAVPAIAVYLMWRRGGPLWRRFPPE